MAIGLSERGQKVMENAANEARQFRHEYIGTEHILLALLATDANNPTNFGTFGLMALGLDLGKIREEVLRMLKPGPEGTKVPETGMLPMTPRAKKVIELAIDEAFTSKDMSVDTNHLGPALIREHDGIAAQILLNMGVALDEYKQEIQHLRYPGGSVTLERDDGLNLQPGEVHISLPDKTDLVIDAKFLACMADSRDPNNRVDYVQFMIKFGTFLADRMPKPVKAG